MSLCQVFSFVLYIGFCFLPRVRIGVPRMVTLRTHLCAFNWSLHFLVGFTTRQGYLLHFAKRCVSSAPQWFSDVIIWIHLNKPLCIKRDSFFLITFIALLQVLPFGIDCTFLVLFYETWNDQLLAKLYMRSPNSQISPHIAKFCDSKVWQDFDMRQSIVKPWKIFFVKKHNWNQISSNIEWDLCQILPNNIKHLWTLPNITKHDRMVILSFDKGSNCSWLWFAWNCSWQLHWRQGGPGLYVL